VKDADFRRRTDIEDRQEVDNSLNDEADYGDIPPAPGRSKLGKALGYDDIPGAAVRGGQLSKDRALNDRMGTVPVRLADVPVDRTAAAKAAIVRAATEAGEDPAFALAVAERESRFNPNRRASKTISGLYQMQGVHRQAYGAGDSTDPYAQAKAWMPFIRDVKGEMGRVLGRDPTDAEAYLGHYYGGVRAAKTLKMDPHTPTDQVFSPTELAQNPEFAHAGTIGDLNAGIMADIGQRQAKYAGAGDSVAGQRAGGAGTSPAPDYTQFSVQAPEASAEADGPDAPVRGAAGTPGSQGDAIAQLASPTISPANAAGSMPTPAPAPPDYTAQSTTGASNA
jgi:hypothetical protein